MSAWCPVHVQRTGLAQYWSGWSITIKHLRLIVWVWRIERVGVFDLLIPSPGKYGLSPLSSLSMFYLECLDNLALHYVPLHLHRPLSRFLLSTAFFLSTL